MQCGCNLKHNIRTLLMRPYLGSYGRSVQLFPQEVSSVISIVLLIISLCILLALSFYLLNLCLSVFLKILSIFREGKGQRKGEKHQCVVASCAPPTGDLACSTGLCPEWEWNQPPFGSQAGPQPT